MQEILKVDTINRVVVWKGFYTVLYPITSPYYQFTMYFTEDYKIRLSVIRQLQN